MTKGRAVAYLGMSGDGWTESNNERPPTTGARIAGCPWDDLPGCRNQCIDIFQFVMRAHCKTHPWAVHRHRRKILHQAGKQYLRGQSPKYSQSFTARLNRLRKNSLNEGHGFSRAVKDICETWFQPLSYGFQDAETEITRFSSGNSLEAVVTFNTEPLE